MLHECARGTFVRPRALTVAEHLDAYIEGATRNIRPATRRSYVDALSPVRLGWAISSCRT